MIPNNAGSSLAPLSQDICRALYCEVTNFAVSVLGWWGAAYIITPSHKHLSHLGVQTSVMLGSANICYAWECKNLSCLGMEFVTSTAVALAVSLFHTRVSKLQLAVSLLHTGVSRL